MAAKTRDSNYIATLVAPNSFDVAEFESALAGASLAASGPARWLSSNSKWIAVEIPVEIPAEVPGGIPEAIPTDIPVQAAAETSTPPHFRTLHKARRDLRECLADRADVALIPAQNRKKKLLVSDMDSTIIEQECLDELAAYAGLKDEIAAITARAMAGELDFEGALTERVGKLDGLAIDALQKCFDERITLMPGAKTLTATMSAHSAFCLLVSGGFTFFTERVAAATGFDAHKGNTLVDDGEALTGEVGRPILGREAKLEALDDCAFANGITRADALAMGDGANDLAMIEAAGLGLAVHAKPIVAAAADAAINVTDLTAALYFQGYSDDEIVWRD